MMHKSKPAASRPLAAAWGRLLLGFSLLLVAAGCSTTPTSIGVGLPSVDANTGAYLVDTLTIKASTVLRDSVVTSTSSYLLVGRYQDPQLGAIKTTSYTTLSLGGAFQPTQAQVADSAVLELVSDTYRYGDTTKTQTLLNVRELGSFLPATSYGFASPKLTPIATQVQPGSLNFTTPVAPRRANRTLGTLRLRLTDAYRDRLMNDGKNGLLTTQEQLDNRYAGLALQPAATDAAALVRFNVGASSGSSAVAESGVIIYYHDPADAATVLSHTFNINNARHFYQVEQDAVGNPVAGLTSLGQLDAALTGQQTYIGGLLGLQTKIEIPYLFDLRNFGQNLVITNATMTAEVPATTLSNILALPTPTTLSVSTTNQRNQPGTAFTNSTYNPTVSTRDGITQAGYTWSVLAYCQNVLSNNVPNNGMLLNTSTPASPERVILGGPKRATNRMQLRLYLISNN